MKLHKAAGAKQFQAPFIIGVVVLLDKMYGTLRDTVMYTYRSSDRHRVLLDMSHSVCSDNEVFSMLFSEKSAGST